MSLNEKRFEEVKNIIQKTLQKVDSKQIDIDNLKIEDLGKTRVILDKALIRTKKMKNKELEISVCSILQLVFFLIERTESAWELSYESLRDFPEEPLILETKKTLLKWKEEDCEYYKNLYK